MSPQQQQQPEPKLLTPKSSPQPKTSSTPFEYPSSNVMLYCSSSNSKKKDRVGAKNSNKGNNDNNGTYKKGISPPPLTIGGTKKKMERRNRNCQSFSPVPRNGRGVVDMKSQQNTSTIKKSFPDFLNKTTDDLPSTRTMINQVLQSSNNPEEIRFQPPTATIKTAAIKPFPPVVSTNRPPPSDLLMQQVELSNSINNTNGMDVDRIVFGAHRNA